MKQLLLLCFLVIAQSIYAQQYKITANLAGFPDHTRFYLKDLAADMDVDSAEIRDNRFVLSGKVSAPRLYWLYSRGKQRFYYTVLLIGPDQVKISGHAADFPFHLKITGSSSQDVYNINRDATREFDLERDSLMQIVIPMLDKQDDSSKVISKRLIRRVKYIDSLNDVKRKEFIRLHLNSYAALSELFFLKKDYSRGQLQGMLNSLRPEFRESNFGKRLANYLKVGDILKKGDPMFDFEALDAQGKTHRLSALKGKYILLDFTETYCGPCILSVEDMRKLASAYADRLRIVSFYADAGKKTWMEGVKRDKPTWLTLWDGKGQYGETVMKYGVTGYPTFVMIDPEGKIIARWSGYGKPENGKGSLEEAVDKLLAGK